MGTTTLHGAAIFMEETKYQSYMKIFLSRTYRQLPAAGCPPAAANPRNAAFRYGLPCGYYGLQVDCNAAFGFDPSLGYHCNAVSPLALCP